MMQKLSVVGIMCNSHCTVGFIVILTSDFSCLRWGGGHAARMARRVVWVGVMHD